VFTHDSVLPAITAPWYEFVVAMDSFRNGYYGCDPLFVSEISRPAVSIACYPNPATSTLTITSTTPISQITITNLLGQVVFRKNSQNEEVQIDVSEFPGGMYFVNIDGLEVRKFLKE